MVSFKNKLEEDAFLVAKKIFGDRAIVEHNKPLRIEDALKPAVASFAGPPKKEIDVLGIEISKNPKLNLLVSCKDFEGSSAEPAHVQEWGAVINTMSNYSGGTRYLGIILCPSGFSRGCESWATTYNLGLIPPLKGKRINFDYDTSLKMFERTLRALSKRIHFPHDNLFVPPGFYDFCFDITGDFEGFEDAAHFGKQSRYFLAETGWRSSFDELLNTFQGHNVKGIIFGPEYLGLKCENGVTVRVFQDRVIFGLFGNESSISHVAPKCYDRISGESRTLEYVSDLVIGKPITSALGAEEYLEFGINKNINILIHPVHGIIVTEFKPGVESATMREIYNEWKKKKRKKRTRKKK